MEEKLVTIVVLPYSRAHILKMRLEAKGIECDLEDIDLTEGTTSFSVKVKILESDVQLAFPVVEEFLGKAPIIEAPPTEKKDRHILVPVDFSENSEKAFKTAFTIARHLQVRLVLMHCYINPLIHSIPFSDVYAYDPSLLDKMEFAEKTANEKFRDFMLKMTEEIGKANLESVPTEFIIKSGYADEDILAFAEKNHPNLIVMGSGGNTPTSYSTMGSTAADAIYNARVPVLVVPEKAPAIDMNQISKVLYATNFDEKDFAVLDKLMALLKPFNTKIFCVHVGQPTGNGWDLARLEGMKDILHEKYKNISFECRLIVGTDTLNSLQKFIDEEKIDILSLTTHKRNMISRLFNPSLARKMVFHSHTPLLVFHA